MQIARMEAVQIVRNLRMKADEIHPALRHHSDGFRGHSLSYIDHRRRAGAAVLDRPHTRNWKVTL